jgi:hypothetical protein
MLPQSFHAQVSNAMTVAVNQEMKGHLLTLNSDLRPEQAFNPVKGRGRVAQLYAALRPQPAGHLPSQCGRNVVRAGK